MYLSLSIVLCHGFINLKRGVTLLKQRNQELMGAMCAREDLF